VVEHPLTIIRSYKEKWIRDKINVDQETLARLREIEGYTNQELALHFGISLTSVKLKLYNLDRTGNRKKNMTMARR
jgi:transposase